MEATLQHDQRMAAGARRSFTAAWAALCLVFVLTALTVAVEKAMHFDGFAIDGPFQLYNALRRIEAGFRPGVDFQFFHGLGLPYVHYGLYRLFGDGLRGSELARQLVTTVVFALVFVVFFRTFTRDWLQTSCLSAAGLAVSFLFPLSALMFALNSMLGLRSAAATLVPAVLFACRTSRTRAIGAGTMLGLALFVSTEQGLAAMLAYALIGGLAVARRRDRRRQAAEVAAIVAIAVAVLVLCLTTVGGVSGMTGALRYNFIVVPKDQYWYFGAPPNLFVPSWGRAAALAIIMWPIGLALLLGSVLSAWRVHRFWREPYGEAGRRNFALAVLPVYGLVSCVSLLGVFETSYVQPCWRTVLLVGLLELSTAADHVPARARAAGRSLLGVPRLMALITLATSAWCVASVPLIAESIFFKLPHVVTGHLFGNVPFGMTGIWPQALAVGQRTFDAHRGVRGEPPVLWSTYAGWLEARNGIFQPSFDYIIHALGPANREAYLARFRATRPVLAQTVLPTYTQYEPWIENTSWDFYVELLRSYRVASITPWSIFWERRTTPGPEAVFVGGMDVPLGLTDVALPPIPMTDTAFATLVEIEVQYETHNTLERLPIIGHIPRYLIGIEGATSQVPISLDPAVRRARFPLLMRPGQTPRLYFRTYSLLPGASWTPRTLAVFIRPVDAANRPWLTNLTARASGGKR